MSTPDVDINLLRRQIETVDSELAQLIAKRLQLADAIGTAKNAQASPTNPLRMGREAAIIKRILREDSAAADPPAFTAIWRAIMGRNVVRQGLGPIYIPGGVDLLKCHDHARLYFGSEADLRVVEDGRTALTLVLDAPMAVAVLSWPGAGGAGQWWPVLGETRFAPLAILGAWPLRQSPQDGRGVAIVGRGVLEPSDPTTDCSILIGIDHQHRAGDLLSQAGFKPIEILRARAMMLAKIEGYVGADDPRLRNLAASTGEHLRLAGVYASA